MEHPTRIKRIAYFHRPRPAVFLRLRNKKRLRLRPQAAQSLRKCGDIANVGRAPSFRQDGDAACRAFGSARRRRLRTSALKVAERIAKLADRDRDPRPRAQRQTAVAASKVGFARAAEIGRESVLPETRAHRRQAERAHAAGAAEARLPRTICSGCTSACSTRRSSRSSSRRPQHPSRSPNSPSAAATARMATTTGRRRAACSSGRSPRSTTICRGSPSSIWRGQRARAAARLTASLRGDRRHRVRRRAA